MVTCWLCVFSHLDKTTTWHDPRLSQLQSAAAQHPISGTPVHGHSLSNPAPATSTQNIDPETGTFPLSPAAPLHKAASHCSAPQCDAVCGFYIHGSMLGIKIISSLINGPAHLCLEKKMNFLLPPKALLVYSVFCESDVIHSVNAGHTQRSVQLNRTNIKDVGQILLFILNTPARHPPLAFSLCTFAAVQVLCLKAGSRLWLQMERCTTSIT